jgi:DNA (cytosine-5)-methyltransferase 1
MSDARAVLTPERENVRQQGRRMKEPGEPMFTLTAQDKHGVVCGDWVRRLMPLECFRLQGFSDDQFFKLVEAGIPEAQLYKMAGNSVTTNVVTAVGLKLMQEVEKLEKEDKKAKNIFHRITEIAKRLFSNFKKSNKKEENDNAESCN